MIRVNNSVEFQRLIAGLAQDVVYANVHWTMYRELFNALNANPIVAAQSNTFWTLTVDAHSRMAIQYLCRVFDQEPQALSLQSWLKTIRQNLHLFDDTQFRQRLADNPFVATLAQDAHRPSAAVLAGDIRLCEARDPLVRLLITYRGNQVAHRNAKGTAMASSAPFVPPALATVEELLRRASEILSRYSIMFNATSHSTHLVGSDDFKFIFSTVNEAVERGRAATQELIARLQRGEAH